VFQESIERSCKPARACHLAEAKDLNCTRWESLPWLRHGSPVPLNYGVHVPLNYGVHVPLNYGVHVRGPHVHAE